MRQSLIILACFLTSFSYGANEPYLVEAKVQTDLENALSRLIPREQYLVQVSTDVVVKQERKVVEAETFDAGSVEPEPVIHVAPMPGFVPEQEPTPAKKTIQSRQTYRTVETPVLQMVRARVDFDDALSIQTLTRGKLLVQNYLKTQYPNKSTAFFNALPMLKPPKPAPEPIKEPVKKSPENEVKEPPKPQLTPEEVLWNYSRWGLFGLVLLSLLLQLRKSSMMFTQLPAPAGGPGMGGNFGAFPNFNSPSVPKFGKRKRNRNSQSGSSTSAVRKRLLEKCILRSESFRSYYQTLSEESRSDLYSALRGPAYEKFLDALDLPRPILNANEPHDLDERLLIHEKNFEEFSQTKEWQDRQFFGFVQTLSDEQLMALVNHEPPLTVCIMLRFMKPNQSAFVLDALPPAKRRDVLGNVHRVKEMHFADLLTLERETRTNAMKMPNHLYGSKKEDTEFWGRVISESHDQDTLLSDLEKTNPEIYTNVAKFKFRLEDAASLPDSLLNQVLSDVDNEELAKALATLATDTTEVFLDALSPQRRNVLLSQITSFRRVSKDQLTEARLKLTRRIRDRMS